MNPAHVPVLIAKIALADPRIQRTDPMERRAQVHMWAGILADVPYDFAVQAAQDHYARQPWPILPADIATRWADTVRDRMTRHTDTFEPTAHPELDPDDIPGYQEALRAERQAIAAGHAEPVELRELAPGPTAEVEARLRELGDYMPSHVRDLLAAHRPVRAERERLAHEGQPDPLAVACGWCGAAIGKPCRGQRRNPKTNQTTSRTRALPHPSRIEAAPA